VQSPLPQLSLDTLIAASPLLGHPLEDRSPIRNAQDFQLVQQWQAETSTPLGNVAQRDLFAVAPLDLLVANREGKKEFHLLELNGTGIGGLTNLSNPAIQAVLRAMQDMAVTQAERYPSPLILIASSGKESEQNPRLNRLIYEKLLYAESFLQGFFESGNPGQLLTTASLQADVGRISQPMPTVVVGYIKEFLRDLRVSEEGRLLLAGRPVTGLVNDRFCLNVLNQFHGKVDLNSVATMNRCHLAGADKGVAYDLLNDFLKSNTVPCFPNAVPYQFARDRQQLISAVMLWRQQGLCPVIKPQGTGLGHGIEFFLDDESEQDVVRKIDRSIALTEEFYSVPGGAFPYTVCQYVDACKLDHPGNPLHGHKYELRVVVYRDENLLKAFPSIIKVAAEPPGTENSQTRGLINNITASCQLAHAKGTDFMFPLANRATLQMFHLDEEQIQSVCHGATRFVRYVLDQVQQNPERLGLPRQQRIADSPMISFDGSTANSQLQWTWPTRNLLETHL